MKRAPAAPFAASKAAFVFLRTGFLCAALFLRFIVAAAAAELKVYYVSVGQGDATYIELPDGKKVLIDGGPNSSDSTLNPIIRFLEGKGVKSIDMVFLSHPHADHYYGLIPVFNRYTVGKYYDSFIVGSGTAESFRTLAKTRATVYEDTRTRNLSTSATFYSITSTDPPLYMVMHHRGDYFGDPPPSANDTSLIFAINFGSSSFLFGGDAGGSGSYKPLEGAVIAQNTASIKKNSRTYRLLQSTPSRQRFVVDGSVPELHKTVVRFYRRRAGKQFRPSPPGHHRPPEKYFIPDESRRARRPLRQRNFRHRLRRNHRGRYDRRR